MSRARTASKPRPANARSVAVDTLVAVLDRHTPLDDAIAHAADGAGLEGRDRAFARALATTTLRHLGRVDRALAPLLKRPPQGAAHAILRAGTAQMLFLDTPPYAAVNAMTDVAKSHAPKLKGLVNAVLRRVGERGHDTIAGLGPEHDWPEWLITSWKAAYGADMAQRIAAASAREAPMDLTVKGSIEAWAERLDATMIPTGSLRLEGAGAPTRLDGYDEGKWWVQDTAATLPARLLGDVAGLRVLDLCAAPGGKTLQLAAAGAQVMAVDRSAKRLARLKENLARTQLEAELVTADALEFRSEEPFDAILLDAPCTATGTLRRHPDVAWSKSHSDVKTLAKTQTALIGAASQSLRPGGRMVFCTCSLQPEEGPEVVHRALEVSAQLIPVALTPQHVAGLPEAIDASGHLRTFPFYLNELGGMDGFFAAVLTRV